MPTSTLLDQLKEVRKDYAEDLVWNRFLLDAYTGTGGFAGKVKPPASGYLGWASEVYRPSTVFAGRTTIDTYLDRFPREDGPKFERRQDVAHYVNYVAPICDLFGSYISSQPPTRNGIDNNTELTAWMQNADGRGTTWDALKDETIIPRALQLGWCPVMFDRDPTPIDVTSKAQQNKLNVRTRAMPLFPGNITQWETDDAGALLWVKIKLSYCSKTDPLAPATEYDKILIWTRTTVSEYRIAKDDKNQEHAEPVRQNEKHSFGAVPLVIFRAGKTPDDTVRGVSVVGHVAVENRRHFNCLSELDEHLRSAVFALLQVPIPPNATSPNELIGGAGNAVPVPSDATQPYKFISPDASVAATYEVRLKESAREIHRIASAPFENDSGAAQSGVSRAYQFEGTNKRLVKIAVGLAAAEETSLQLVATSHGAAANDVENIRCAPPNEFRVDDLSVDLDNLIKAVSVRGMAATAKMLIILRSVQKMLPNMHEDQRKLIEGELLKTRDAENAQPIEPGPQDVPSNNKPPAPAQAA